MQQPIWLLSLDSDTFPAAPMTTGGLKAYADGTVVFNNAIMHNRNPTRCHMWMRIFG